MRFLTTVVLVCLPAVAHGGLEEDWKKIEKGGNLQSRRLFGFALEAVAADWHPERVEAVFRKVEKMQDRDPESRTYGNFRWYWDEAGVTDRNAVEFCMEQGSLIWKYHRDRLTPAARASLEQMIRLAAEGLEGHGVGVGYTNIFLMKTWNCLALGESAGMPELKQQGLEMLDAWLLYTRMNGVREYLSPTYTGVDLRCLGLIANHCGDEAARGKAKAALELVWTNVAANWFYPAARLGGPHSRDYDYLTGQGILDRIIARAGWKDDARPVDDEFHRRSFHAPPPGLPERFEAPRMVRQRWGAGTKTAAQWVGRSLSIGSAGESYPDMDKFLTVNFAGGPKMVGLNFLMDARRDPYGKRRNRLVHHAKAWKISPFVTSVQRGPEVLLLANALPGSRDFRRVPEPDCLHSTFALPAGVEVFIGSKPAVSERQKQTVIDISEPVFLRFRDTALAIRFVHATSESRNGPVVELVRDAEKYGAMRLSCIHSEGAPKEPATVALWLRGAEGLDDAGFETFRRGFPAAGCSAKLDKGVLTVTARGLHGELKLVADLDQRIRLEQAGTGPLPDDYLLLVDDQELGQPILDRLDVVQTMFASLEKHREAMEGIEAQPGNPVGEAFEAESSPSLIGPFQLKVDKEASGGKHLVASQTSAFDLPVPWPVEIPEDGTYTVRGRVKAANPSEDSFRVWFQQGGAPIGEAFDWHTGTHRKWEWTQAQGQDRKLFRVKLRKGKAVLLLGRREAGTMVDELKVVQVDE